MRMINDQRPVKRSDLLSPVRDGAKIAQHFSAGDEVKATTKSRQGRQAIELSVVPDGTQSQSINRYPSTEVLGYFRVSLAGQKQSRSIRVTNLADVTALLASVSLTPSNLRP